MKYLVYPVAALFFMVSGGVFAEAQPATSSAPVYTQDKPAILVKKDHPEFTIKLKSNATTGYSWFLRSYDDHLIAPVAHHYQRPTSQLVGAPGFEMWTFRVKPEGFIVPQVTYIRFDYSRPWETGAQTNSQFEFKITTGS